MAGRRWLPFEERFWGRVQKTDGCWLWTGNKMRRGYGITYNAGIYEGGKREPAHRISYRLAYGDFPKNLLVCHHCDNPPCVKPDHLFLGTHKDNFLDAKNKNRVPTGVRHWTSVKPELIKRGFKSPERALSGSTNPNSRLTEKDVSRIRFLRSKGSKYADLAKAFNVKQDTIEGICLRRSWKHI